MGYWTDRDFINPIEKGNNKCEMKRFQTVYEGRGRKVLINCNLGGLLSASDIVLVSIDFDNRNEFIKQIQEYNFKNAEEILALWEIIHNSRILCLTKEELAEIDKKIINSNIKKLDIDSFYFDAKALIRAAKYLKIECCGGAVNGGITITDPQENVIFNGYYNFRYNRFNNKEQNKKMMSALAQWRGENGEKEDFILKLFSQE